MITLAGKGKLVVDTLPSDAASPLTVAPGRSVASRCGCPLYRAAFAATYPSRHVCMCVVFPCGQAPIVALVADSSPRTPSALPPPARTPYRMHTHSSRLRASRKTLRLAEDFDYVKNFPFCTLVMANLGMRFDRLTPVQQMTLKVGSMIGFEWRFRQLMDVFPLEHYKPELLGVRCRSCADGVPCVCVPARRRCRASTDHGVGRHLEGAPPTAAPPFLCVVRGAALFCMCRVWLAVERSRRLRWSTFTSWHPSCCHPQPARAPPGRWAAATAAVVAAFPPPPHLPSLAPLLFGALWLVPSPLLPLSACRQPRCSRVQL
jgi:hypothetical protein